MRGASHRAGRARDGASRCGRARCAKRRREALSNGLRRSAAAHSLPRPMEARRPKPGAIPAIRRTRHRKKMGRFRRRALCACASESSRARRRRHSALRAGSAVLARATDRPTRARAATEGRSRNERLGWQHREHHSKGHVCPRLRRSGASDRSARRTARCGSALDRASRRDPKRAAQSGTHVGCAAERAAHAASHARVRRPSAAAALDAEHSRVPPACAPPQGAPRPSRTEIEAVAALIGPRQQHIAPFISAVNVARQTQRGGASKGSHPRIP